MTHIKQSLNKVQNTVSSSIRKYGACFWPDRPSTMHVNLETSMLIRKAASARLTMSTSYETNTPPLSTKPRMLEGCALTVRDANQVPLSAEHRD